MSGREVGDYGPSGWVVWSEKHQRWVTIPFAQMPTWPGGNALHGGDAIIAQAAGKPHQPGLFEESPRA